MACSCTTFRMAYKFPCPPDLKSYTKMLEIKSFFLLLFYSASILVFKSTYPISSSLLTNCMKQHRVLSPSLSHLTWARCLQKQSSCSSTFSSLKLKIASLDKFSVFANPLLHLSSSFLIHFFCFSKSPNTFHPTALSYQLQF